MSTMDGFTLHWWYKYVTFSMVLYSSHYFLLVFREINGHGQRVACYWLSLMSCFSQSMSDSSVHLNNLKNGRGNIFLSGSPFSCALYHDTLSTRRVTLCWFRDVQHNWKKMIADLKILSFFLSLVFRSRKLCHDSWVMTCCTSSSCPNAYNTQTYIKKVTKHKSNWFWNVFLLAKTFSLCPYQSRTSGILDMCQQACHRKWNGGGEETFRWPFKEIGSLIIVITITIVIISLLLNIIMSTDHGYTNTGSDPQDGNINKGVTT